MRTDTFPNETLTRSILDVVVAGPLVLDSSTFLNFEQHFLKGCSYSISIWVWLWKRKHPLSANEELVIFTTRALEPPSDDPNNILYPTIIYNVGNDPSKTEKFFFAAIRDMKGFNSGVWPRNAEVKYNQWIHLAMVIEETDMFTYMNGVLLDRTWVVSRDDFAKRSCPYIALNFTSGLLNNTITQVGGVRGRKASVGIFQDFLVYRNIALSPEDIAELFLKRRPMKLPTLAKMMQANGIFTVENFCPQDWETNFYLAASWQLCPPIVCGPICLDEAFIIGAGKTAVSPATSTGNLYCEDVVATESESPHGEIAEEMLWDNSWLENAIRNSPADTFELDPNGGAVSQGTSAESLKNEMLDDRRSAEQNSNAAEELARQILHYSRYGTNEPPIFANNNYDETIDHIYGYPYDDNDIYEDDYYNDDYADKEYGPAGVTEDSLSLKTLITLARLAVAEVDKEQMRIVSAKLQRSFERLRRQGGTALEDEFKNLGFLSRGEEELNDSSTKRAQGNVTPKSVSTGQIFDDPYGEDDYDIGFAELIGFAQRAREDEDFLGMRLALDLFTTKGVHWENEPGTATKIRITLEEIVFFSERANDEGDLLGMRLGAIALQNRILDLEKQGEDVLEEELAKLEDPYGGLMGDDDKATKAIKPAKMFLVAPKSPSTVASSSSGEVKMRKSCVFIQRSAASGTAVSPEDLLVEVFPTRLRPRGSLRLEDEGHTGFLPLRMSAEEVLPGHVDEALSREELYIALGINADDLEALKDIEAVVEEVGDGESQHASALNMAAILKKFSYPWRSLRTFAHTYWSALTQSLGVTNSTKTLMESSSASDHAKSSDIGQQRHSALLRRPEYRSIQRSQKKARQAYEAAIIWMSRREEISMQYLTAEADAFAVVEKAKNSLACFTSSLKETGYNDTLRELSESIESKVSQIRENSDRVDAEFAEKSFSALALAKFFADDSLDPADRIGLSYPFLFAAPVSYPVNLALGFRAGFDSDRRIQSLKSRGHSHPSGVQMNVGRLLGGIDLPNLLNLTAKTATENQDSCSSGVCSNASSGLVRYILDVLPEPLSQNECAISASYYFPLTQYVIVNWAQVEAGVASLEDVRFRALNARAMGLKGEDDELHLHHQMEADAGDDNVQMMMALKYFWGLGGVQPNVMAARRWFERAAARGNPEALYNLGVFHFHGQAGFPRNEARAIEYFERAANPNADAGVPGEVGAGGARGQAFRAPYPMAIHALGNHYLYSPGDKRNLTLAKRYYEQAANLDSPDGHFSLAMMLREGIAGSVDIPLALFHLARAASMQHVRSLNFLAHAYLDWESWLGEYARAERLQSKQQAESADKVSTATGDDDSRETPSPDGKEQSASPVPAGDSAKTKKNTSISFWRYNESAPVYVNLPYDRILLPKPFIPSCSVALPILKFLAEMSGRPRDLTRAGLNAYLRGDLWTALDYYEEAAELGILSAIDNSLYLYETLMKRECHDGLAALTLLNVAEARGSNNESSSVVPDFFRGAAKSWIGFAMEMLSQRRRTLHKFTQDTFILPKAICELHFERLRGRRLLQMARFGEHAAHRELGKRLLSDRAPELAGGNKRVTQAALLFGLAVEGGDTEALMSLGWLLQSHEMAGLRNVTASLRAFRTARRWESGTLYYTLGGDWHGDEGDEEDKNYVPRASTHGLAPLLAEVYTHATLLAESFGLPSIDMWSKPHKTRVYRSCSSATTDLDDTIVINENSALSCSILVFVLLLVVFLLRKLYRET